MRYVSLDHVLFTVNQTRSEYPDPTGLPSTVHKNGVRQIHYSQMCVNRTMLQLWQIFINQLQPFLAWSNVLHLHKSMWYASHIVLALKADLKKCLHV